jgi:hypothetical protein
MQTVINIYSVKNNNISNNASINIGKTPAGSCFASGVLDLSDQDQITNPSMPVGNQI